MDQEINNESASGGTWPEVLDDSSPTQSIARSVTLDTVSSIAEGRMAEINSNVDLIQTRLGALEQIVLEGAPGAGLDQGTQSRIREIENSLMSAGSHFNELANRVAQTEEQITTTVISSVDGFDTRIALIEDARLAQANELNELTGYLEQAFTRITELAGVIESNNAQNTDALERVEGQLEGTQTSASISALETVVADIDQRAEDSNEHLQRRIAEIEFAATAPLAEVEARIEAQSDKLVEHGERLHSHDDRLETHEAELAHQFKDIERLNQASLAQEQVTSELAEQLGLHSQGLEELKTQVATAADSATLAEHSDTLATHNDEIGELKSLLDSSHQSAIVGAAEDSERVEQLVRGNGDRISSIVSTAELLGQRIDLIEKSGSETAKRTLENSESTRNATANISGLTDDVQSLESKIDATSISIAEIHSRIEGFDVENLTTDTSELGAELATMNARIDEVLTGNEDLSSSVTSLSGRVDELGAQKTVSASASDASIERMAELTAAANSANNTAEEAQRLADSLRVIQTEVVQTMKSELGDHTSRLSNLEHSSSLSEGTSERVKQLETKLVEALQTISQLTQLQRRHTAVETQITDALGSTNQGVEHTQQHVISLRTELDRANARITHLETALASVTGQSAQSAAQVATPPAPAQPTAQPTPSELQAAFESPSTSDESDTSWFDESYERRNAS